MVSVEFQVFLIENADLVELNEAAIAADPMRLRDQLNVPEVLEGALRIAADGQPSVEVVDELWQLVQVLCFASACALAGDAPQPFRYRYLSSGFELTLTPSGEDLLVTGGDVPSVAVDRAQLLGALHRCGLRFLDLLKALGPPRAELLAHLDPFAERAGDCLAPQGENPF